MKTRFKFLMYGLFALAVTITSCETEELQGPIGPAGQMGEQGIAGPEGPKGENGEALGVPGAQGEPGATGLAGTDGADGTNGTNGVDGEDGTNGTNGADGEEGTNGTDGADGNANVIVSDWYEPKESSFSVNNPGYKAFPLARSIKGKVKNGVILVYYDSDIQVQVLPRHTFDSSGSALKSIDSHINHASNTLYVTIRKYGSNLTEREYLWNPSGPAYGKGVRFRYVIIPNGISSKNSGIDFKKMSYKEVMDHFGIEY